MWYVYIIRSINFPEQEYIGATSDLKQRLPDHNASRSTHTAKFKPWQLVWYCAFPDKYKALAFPAGHLQRSGSNVRISLPPPYSSSTASSRSRIATRSFFIADSSAI